MHYGMTLLFLKAVITFQDINEFIQREMRKMVTMIKQRIMITSKYLLISTHSSLKWFSRITMKLISDINTLLGFHSKLYTSGFNESENMVNIFTINSILVNIDIIWGSYVNDSKQSTICSFFPDVSPGYKIIKNPHNLLYLPITADTIHSSTIWLTDQNGN